MSLRARERWFITRLGQWAGFPIEVSRIQVRGGRPIYGPRKILYFKTGGEVDDFIENYVLQKRWHDGELESVSTIVFDYTKVETWTSTKFYHIYFVPPPDEDVIMEDVTMGTEFPPMS